MSIPQSFIKFINSFKTKYSSQQYENPNSTFGRSRDNLAWAGVFFVLLGTLFFFDLVHLQLLAAHFIVGMFLWRVFTHYVGPLRELEHLLVMGGFYLLFVRSMYFWSDWLWEPVVVSPLVHLEEGVRLMLFKVHNPNLDFVVPSSGLLLHYVYMLQKLYPEVFTENILNLLCERVHALHRMPDPQLREAQLWLIVSQLNELKDCIHFQQLLTCTLPTSALEDSLNFYRAAVALLFSVFIDLFFMVYAYCTKTEISCQFRFGTTLKSGAFKGYKTWELNYSPTNGFFLNDELYTKLNEIYVSFSQPSLSTLGNPSLTLLAILIGFVALFLATLPDNNKK